ncbi:serine/threonine protein phosphatase [Ornithinibacillus gellani]|uniref:metallophosphoesterase family protein n=1 Tax=Ornithinibacillus gellani TaxID=2293253 RepID=UPI000F467E55|nr:metallophosphoesterase family protein [Ornithinibacillus gellani]TQS75386.1 serine/threonine protein phosphatase [Ornithinibacillus gellani]
MKRTLVTSDIHGEITAFENILKLADYNPEKDQLILLGDYVDRGPNSKAVLEKVIELKETGAIVLRGNHDDMMVAAADGQDGAWERWERNGAIFTLKSYDSTIDSMQLPDSELFSAHVDFIKQLDYYYETDTHIFVHAGVVPGQPIAETDPHDLVWIRDAFHRGYEGEKTVVFGHTPTAALNQSGNYDVYYGNNRIIGIDGGCVFGGQLNCLDLNSGKVYTSKGMFGKK